MADETDLTPTLDELVADSPELGTALQPDGIETSGEVQMFPFPFCFRYSGRPWQSTFINAPGPGEAGMTADGIVGMLNMAAVRKGYQALFSVTGGSCP
ncbi:hypothetical protein OG352_27080 [Streptomyces sp. NBC_01485]|uniref:hypothetical protein n=1 Tax=Streptomyces sp. NBC_01485 TaxID=2903884 RepID=UPI002E33F957|nr:hypothetical protein [Streptomyces sp. NBC_01485]